MIFELYGKTIRFTARAILLTASAVSLLIFLIDIVTLISDKIEHSPPIAFIIAPIMGFGSYYASRFFAPPKENIADDPKNGDTNQLK
jgi:hypothetical protein